MRTINYFDNAPKETEIVVIGDKASVFVRQDIEKIKLDDLDGEQRTAYRAIEYSCIVNANGFTLTEAFIERLIAVETEKAAKEIRAKRDALLAASDKEMLYDRVESKPSKSTSEWVSYRKALREIPEQKGFPFDVAFPEIPKDEEEKI